MNIDEIFWKNQKILKNYKNNNLFYISTASFTTFTPLVVIYGLFYEKYIRKIPFHVQFAVIIIMYKSSLKFIQEIKYQAERIYKEINI